LRACSRWPQWSFADERSPSQPGCPAAVTRTSHSAPQGAKEIAKVELDCGSDWYTLVDMGPSRKHNGDNSHVCTVYVQASLVVVASRRLLLLHQTCTALSEARLVQRMLSLHLAKGVATMSHRLIAARSRLFLQSGGRCASASSWTESRSRLDRPAGASSSSTGLLGLQRDRRANA